MQIYPGQELSIGGVKTFSLIIVQVAKLSRFQAASFSIAPNHVCFNNNKSQNQSNKQKGIISTHKTYWKADILTAEERKKKKKEAALYWALDILSDGTFVFFSNKNTKPMKI